jgi:clostripain
MVTSSCGLVGAGIPFVPKNVVKNNTVLDQGKLEKEIFALDFHNSFDRASCSADWQETSAVVGQTIHADFTWSGAFYHPNYGFWATMCIIDPNDEPRISYTECFASSGSHTLSFQTDMAGTWRANIFVWTGFSSHMEDDDYIDVIPGPQLSFSPSSINFGTQYQGWTGSSTFEIWNSGGGTLTYSLSESLNWITVNPTSGSSTGEHDTITVSVVNTGGMTGYYSGYIYISSNGGSGSIFVDITINQDYQPILSYSPTEIHFGTHDQGWTGSSTFEIWNSGTGTLTYSSSESISWITSINPNSGTSTGEHDTITINVGNTGGMSGYYSGTISISSNGGLGSIFVEITIEEPQTGDWTVIAYLCGDNNLESWCQQSLNYMTTVGSQNGTEIIALFDGASSGDTHAYHVLHDNQVNIPLNSINPNWGNEVNMGDPQVLISFSIYCINNYPADHYMIIPQDHGGSWVGCCWDDHGDNLNINELKTAFQQISGMLGKKVDLVFFNDCLMNSVEIAYQLNPYVEFQAGAETISWVSTCDNEYENILQNMVNNPTITPQDLANYITNAQSLHDSPSYRTQSLSTFDLSTMQNLVTAVDALAVDLYNKLDVSTYRSQIETARTQSEYTEGPSGGQIERLIDLYEFASLINTYVSDPSTKYLAQDIMSYIGPFGGQVGYTVTRARNTTSADFCHGMSIYFPDRANRYSGNYLNGNNFASNTYWNEFLSEYLSGTASNGWGWDANIKATAKDGDTYFTFGEAEDATDGFDSDLDVQYSDETTNVEIYSVKSGIDYSVDIRYGPDTNKIWDINAKWQGLDSTTITLTWDASLIPYDEYVSVILYDYDSNTQTNIRTSSTYSFNSNASETRHMKIICSSSESNAPIKPQPPSGPTSGEPGVEYTYTAVTIDPDGDLISYVFNWSDGTTTQTTFVPSGQVASAVHEWSQKGDYQIRVKAVDEHGMESEWSDPLPISMPMEQPGSQQGNNQQLLVKQIIQSNQFLHMVKTVAKITNN